MAVRPQDVSGLNPLATPEAFVAHGQAELAELQRALPADEEALRLERVSSR